jgi:hypothetical protein
MAIFTPQQEQELLNTVKIDCKSNNIKLYFGTGKSVRDPDGFKCGGYFCNSVNKLAVAKGNENWPMIMLHEYCHLQQWTEKCDHWTNFKFKVDYIGEWLSQSRKVTESKLDEVFYKTMLLEHDCEKRKIAYLRKLGINKNKIQEEIQKSNAYILFYMYVKKNQIWNLPKYPNRIKEIWSECPKNFNYDIYKSFKRVEHLYDYHL